MTVDVFPPVVTHIVAGTGPYSVPFGFSDPSHVVLRLFTADGSSELLGGDLWSLTPAGTAQAGYTGGSISLTAEAAADLAGMSIRPERFSNLEQGWEADASPRERGLKRQLDWLTRATQENAARLARAIITRGPVQPMTPAAGGVVIFNDQLQPVPGPSADAITSAQTHAEAAIAAAAAAEGFKDAAEEAATHVIVNTDIDAAIAANSTVAANTAKQTNATHTGDVTGSAELTIAGNAVTNTKLADMVTGTVKGRATAETGDPEDLTGGAVLGVIVGAVASASTPSGAGNWAPHWASFINADWIVTANRTLSNPTNVIAGTTRTIMLSADNTTARTIAFGSNFKGPIGDVPTVASNKRVLLVLYAYSTTVIVVSFVELDA